MVQFRDINNIPYVIKSGLSRDKMVSIWKVHGLKKIEFTHWLKRRVVRIELLNQLPMGRRLPVAIAGYQRTLDRFFPMF